MLEGSTVESLILEQDACVLHYFYRYSHENNDVHCLPFMLYRKLEDSDS